VQLGGVLHQLDVVGAGRADDTAVGRLVRVGFTGGFVAVGRGTGLVAMLR